MLAQGHGMTCQTCGDTGFWPYVDSDNPKPDEHVTGADLFVAVCLCEAGMAWRQRENHGRKVPPLWLVWCAQHQVSPNRVCLLEDVWTTAEMSAAGFSKPVAQISREAALLAADRRKR